MKYITVPTMRSALLVVFGAFYFLTGCRSGSIIKKVPDTSLLAYYPFNHNTDDATMYHHNGIGSSLGYTTDRFGHSNSAGLFGSGTIVHIPELFNNSIKAFTFSAWVRKSFSDNNNHMIIYKGSIRGEAALNITNGNVGFGVNVYNPSSSSEQNWYSAVTTDTLRPNVDYFLVGRYSRGGTVELLINGKLAASITVPDLKLWSASNGGYSSLGTHSNADIAPSYYWNGIIDDVRIFGRSLSNSDVQTLYHEGGWRGN